MLWALLLLRSAVDGDMEAFEDASKLLTRPLLSACRPSGMLYPEEILIDSSVFSR